jgi:hypothetical protein
MFPRYIPRIGCQEGMASTTPCGLPETAPAGAGPVRKTVSPSTGEWSTDSKAENGIPGGAPLGRRGPSHACGGAASTVTLLGAVDMRLRPSACRFFSHSQRTFFHALSGTLELLLLFLLRKTAIDKPCCYGSRNGGDPEQPQLLKGPASDKDGRTG